MIDLRGRNALVMGGTTGIGAAVCELLVESGASVAVADLRDPLPIAEGAAGVGLMNSQVNRLRADVRDLASVVAAIDNATAAFGSVDILINNAGVSFPARPFIDSAWDDWTQTFDVNLRGVAYAMKHVLPQMISRRWGRIINTASQLAHKPAAGDAVYSASKAGVVALTAAVAQEVAEFGVTVNCVCPGPTDTPMWRDGDPAWNAWKLGQLPIKRIGTPREIASAYVYLCSDLASYMIGQSISPNGGDVMW